MAHREARQTNSNHPAAFDADAAAPPGCCQRVVAGPRTGQTLPLSQFAIIVGDHKYINGSVHDHESWNGLAVDETAILLHPPLPLVNLGASIVMERERQQNDGLADG